MTTPTPLRQATRLRTAGATAPLVPAPRILAVGRALPPHRADQESITAALRDAWGKAHYNVERLEDLHRAVQVDGRYLALPIEDYAKLDSFSARNDAWIQSAIDLGAAAVRDALVRADLGPEAIDHLVFVTTTGIATPSIDARLVNRLGLCDRVRRTPIFGLGCAAGAAGVARAADFLRAHPGDVALVLSVEICSLTLQRADVSISNIIASGLFGDGAACVVLAGGHHVSAGRSDADRRPSTEAGDGCAPGDSRRSHPRVLGSGSFFYPHTERLMGWDVVDGGFRIVLSAKVPAAVGGHVAGNVDAFLAQHGLDRARIDHWIAHTGGPRVLRAIEDGLELPAGALARSWESLRAVGNLSSASVLFVLGEALDRGASPGDHGLLMAMGPGFGAELTLLQWDGAAG